MTTQSASTAATSGMCMHMVEVITKRGYVRGADGRLIVKICESPSQSIAPSRIVLRPTCGHTSPIGSASCYSCGGTSFSEAPAGIRELETCHYRCKNCRWVTKGCETAKCGYCGSSDITLLPPAINPDVYGFNLILPKTEVV